MLPRKVALHTSSHLMPIEAWQSAVSTTLEGRSFERGTVRKMHAGLGGGPNLDSVRLTVEKKYCFTPVQTCPNLSEPVHITVVMYARHTMSFLHFRMLLFFSLTFYPAEIAYFNLPNGELSYGVRVMALYLSKIVDPSRSPCLKTVDRKCSERRNC